MKARMCTCRGWKVLYPIPDSGTVFPLYFQNETLLRMSKLVPHLFANKNDTLKFARNLLKLEVFFEELNYIAETESAAYTVRSSSIYQYMNVTYIMVSLHTDPFFHHIRKGHPLTMGWVGVLILLFTFFVCLFFEKKNVCAKPLDSLLLKSLFYFPNAI